MRRFSLLFVLYIVLGVIVALNRHKITGAMLRDIAEAIIVILLWPLTAFGIVNIRI